MIRLHLLPTRMLLLIALWQSAGVYAESPTVFLNEKSEGWFNLHIVDGVDPSLEDTDFMSTWFKQDLGAYAGADYDGPAFGGPATAPFHYGGVGGLAGGSVLEVPPMGKRFTSYFLKVIQGGPQGSAPLDIDMLVDDGAFIYLNGQLAGRIGTRNEDTYLAKAKKQGAESSFQPVIPVGEPRLRPGPNLLAISLHNRGPRSSDLGFDIKIADPLIEVPMKTGILRGPYLQSGAHDRATLCWRTSFKGSSRVRYGTRPEALDQDLRKDVQVSNHAVTLKGLQPGTRYYYQVITENGMSKVSSALSEDYYFCTYPDKGAHVPTRVWIIGDSGTTTHNKMQVYQAYRDRTKGAHTDVWLMLGDNAYGRGRDGEFQRAVFDAYPELLRNTFLWSCIGNHECNTRGGEPYVQIHRFPTRAECGGIASGSERYYSFNHGNIHFISLDSQTEGNFDDVPGSGGMIDWLERDLQATDQDWIVAFFHHGPYTKGSHDSDVEIKHQRMRVFVLPLLERYGADLVLSGHSHCYERSMLIRGHHSAFDPRKNSNSDTFQEAMAIDAGNGSDLGGVDASGNFHKGSDWAQGGYQKGVGRGGLGTIYSICGASGKISRWNDETNEMVNPHPHPVHIVSLRAMGSMILTTDGRVMHAQYLDQHNRIRDDFRIEKRAMPDTRP